MTSRMTSNSTKRAADQREPARILGKLADALVELDDVRGQDRKQIRTALKLLTGSNPTLVMFMLYELAAIYEEYDDAD